MTGVRHGECTSRCTAAEAPSTVAVQRVLPALLDHLVDVKLERCHQDVVQGLRAALTSQKQVKAGLWKGGDPFSPWMVAETQGSRQGWGHGCLPESSLALGQAQKPVLLNKGLHNHLINDIN